MAWNDPNPNPNQVYQNQISVGAQTATPPIESQLERSARLCKGLAELHTRLNYINVKVRGQVPQDGRIEKTPEQPEVTLLNLSRIAESLLERCHIEVNELTAQIGS